MKKCFIVSSGKEHTVNGNEFEEPFTSIRRELRVVLEKLCSMGYQHFITTADWGIPLWVGEVGVKMREQYPDVTISIIIPYEEQAKDWLEYQRDRYFKLHQNADNVVLLHTRWCEEAEDDAINYALELSDMLFVFGKPDDGLLAVQWAEARKMKIVYI